MSERTVGRTLGNLVLALLNATLILIALCLWLTWRVFASVEGISEQVADVSAQVGPLREEVVALREEVAETRAEMTALREQLASARTVDFSGVQERLAAVEATGQQITEALRALEGGAGPLVDRAVAAGFAGLSSTVSDAITAFRCEAPSS